MFLHEGKTGCSLNDNTPVKIFNAKAWLSRSNDFHDLSRSMTMVHFRITFLYTIKKKIIGEGLDFGSKNAHEEC